MNVLVVDIGGNGAKLLITGETEPRKFPSGPKMIPRKRVSRALKLTAAWNYDAVVKEENHEAPFAQNQNRLHHRTGF